MSDAYVETTILADVLLKPNSRKQARAKAALAKYTNTLLPVYSIKEWKAGPLYSFSYVHDKLVQTRSLADTILAISELPRLGYRRSTSDEALAAAAQTVRRQQSRYVGLGNTDEDHADSYRLALVSIISRSWQKRRQITTQVVKELPCYFETAPRIGKDGLFEFHPKECDPEQQCSLAVELKAKPELLEALRKAIPQDSDRREDQKRRQALKQLIKHPKDPVTRETCQDLGDAIFAFFCPTNAVILTTNLRDHRPLANALGKTAESP